MSSAPSCPGGTPNPIPLATSSGGSSACDVGDSNCSLCHGTGRFPVQLIDRDEPLMFLCWYCLTRSSDE